MSIPFIRKYNTEDFALHAKEYQRLLSEYPPRDRSLIPLLISWMWTESNRDNAYISALIVFHVLSVQCVGQCEIISDLPTDGEIYRFIKSYLCSQLNKETEKSFSFYDIEQYLDPQVALESEKAFGFDERYNGMKDIPLFGNAIMYPPRFKEILFNRLKMMQSMIEKDCTSYGGVYLTKDAVHSPALQRFINDAKDIFKDLDIMIPFEGINELTGFEDHILCPNSEALMRAIDFYIGHERRHIWQLTHKEEAEALYKNMEKQLWVRRQKCRSKHKRESTKFLMAEMDADRHGLIHMVKQMHRRRKNYHGNEKSGIQQIY